MGGADGRAVVVAGKVCQGDEIEVVAAAVEAAR